MKTKILRDEFMIRTLKYYQKLGGVFSELITILSRLRDMPGHRNMPLPARALNEACYQYAIFTNDGNASSLADSPPLVGCLIASMAADVGDEAALSLLMPMIKADKGYYPHFSDIIGRRASAVNNNDMAEIQVLQHERDALRRQLEMKDEIIHLHESTIASQSTTIDNLGADISKMAKQCSIAERRQYDGSDFDRLLSLDTILQWVESRHHYMYTEQVFRMLSDLKDKVATDEEREKIRAVEERMLDKNQINAVFNQNYAMNSNMMTGMVQSPQMPIGMSAEDIDNAITRMLKNINDGK